MKETANQNGVVPAHDEISVVCPKPRRHGLFNHHPVRPFPFRWQHLSCQVEPCDSNSSVSNPLDTILAKDGDFEVEQPWPVVSSSPPFCGSPPSRAANPLIQDSRFGDENFCPLSPPPPPPGVLSQSPSSSASSLRKGGCVPPTFGNHPAVRIEGFDCLDRDRRNCSIPALA